MENTDLKTLESTLNPDKTRISYADNRHLFIRVAFDVFKMTGSPVESYWTLEKDDDGKEYLVANYEKSVDAPEIQVNSNWEALSDKRAENITLLYRGVPIKRFASSEYKFDDENLHLFKKALIEKLSSDHEFVDSLMNVLPEEKRKALVEAFSELATKE